MMPATYDEWKLQAPPELTASEEQRIADWKYDIAKRDDRVRHVIAKYCHGWSADDFLLLAKQSLEQFLDLRNSRLTLVQAYELIDDAVDEMNKMPEADDGRTET